MKTIAVIGKNFGDEGKGLVTSGLCSFFECPLVIRHNGGGQSGHTVEDERKGTRFIHHQIGCGAEKGVPTFWTDTFHPDLYQFGNEMADFRKEYGLVPRIFAHPDATVTTVDDVLINMAVETRRGSERHGSCGMGINECCERNAAGYAVTLKDIAGADSERLAGKLERIRREYSLQRARELGIGTDNPYMPLLNAPEVLYNFAAEVVQNSICIEFVDPDIVWLKQFDALIFETGQGLLLDMNRSEYAPHVTASETGIAEAVRFLNKYGMRLDEAVYVTRPYVTRHGAGELCCECDRSELPGVERDRTNEPNEWQGAIRYARHESIEAFLEPVRRDIAYTGVRASLAVTHLNETDGNMYFADRDIRFRDFSEIVRPEFGRIFASWDRGTVVDAEC